MFERFIIGSLTAGLVTLTSVPAIQVISMVREQDAVRRNIYTEVSAAWDKHVERLGVELEHEASIGGPVADEALERNVVARYHPASETYEFSPFTTRDAVEHEVAHHFYDQHIEQRIERGNAPTLDPWSDDPVSRMIAEGFADSLALDRVPNWPSQRFGFNAYTRGHALVSPIIDAHGIDGLDYLLDQPPNSTKIDDLKAYQERALEELATSSTRLRTP